MQFEDSIHECIEPSRKSKLITLTGANLNQMSYWNFIRFIQISFYM
jgi:hypothetical protein